MIGFASPFCFRSTLIGSGYAQSAGGRQSAEHWIQLPRPSLFRAFLCGSNRGRTFYSGQQGGLNMLRDIPRYVKMIEQGTIDMQSMITATYPLERTREAIQAVGDRTVLGAVITFA